MRGGVPNMDILTQMKINKREVAPEIFRQRG